MGPVELEAGGKKAEVAAAFETLAGAEEDQHYEQHVRHSNPIRRFLNWWMSWWIPGMGMMAEAYFVFSVGNLKGIWTQQYPECFKTHEVCSKSLSNTLTYTQVSGIILGQLAIGFIADRIGRKWGSVMNAAIMFVFGILMAASSGSDAGNIFAMFTACQFLFGVGVGGEYPVASTSANERAENTKHLQKRRGETVVCVFSMQGWGNLFNTMVLIILMAAFDQYGPDYSDHRLNLVWRLSYGIGLIPIFFMLLWRIFKLQESKVWIRKRSSLKMMESGSSLKRNMLLLRHYWHRVGGTALAWFVWDFAFYGNKLFQSTFIKIINPDSSLIQVLEWTLLNSTVALVGYYFAAFTIDRPWMGRTRMQSMGFAWMGVLFLICAADYTHLTKGGIHWFQFLYYFSSFWGQFGPNATTWLLPAELVPTEMRSQCHGFSAAVGKAGALVAGVVFGLVDDRAKFWISAACGLAGVVVTVIFIPDITTLDLKEGDKRWLAIVSGNDTVYEGEAVNPKYLSLIERWLGYGKLYNPAAAAAENNGKTESNGSPKA